MNRFRMGTGMALGAAALLAASAASAMTYRLDHFEVTRDGAPLFFDGIGIPAAYQMRDLIAFTVLLMVLIFRPSGLFGETLARKRA